MNRRFGIEVREVFENLPIIVMGAIICLRSSPHNIDASITGRCFSSQGASTSGPGPEENGIAPQKGSEGITAPRKPGEGRDLVMIFTCNVCQTRAVKSMSRQARLLESDGSTAAPPPFI